ncbi:hypothetical protein D7322_28050 [Sphingobacterium puteale]|uniref:SH3 domain-containing protein n=2 Tax=Sphingobacterium puteale TaxID=2420510 RepID=A0A420VPP2_9SPHI|nr:hypothetical protein D7322_28050 [Sphingobacterium puteale]
MLFTYWIYLLAVRDSKYIKNKYSPNSEVISTTAVYKRPKINSHIIDTLHSGVKLNARNVNQDFYRIIFAEEYNSLKGSYIPKKALKFFNDTEL